MMLKLLYSEYKMFMNYIVLSSLWVTFCDCRLQSVHISHLKYIYIFCRDNRYSPADRKVVCGLTITKLA